MQDRPPKFYFQARAQTYGKLDTSAELVVCLVSSGNPVQINCPASWSSGVSQVNSSKPTSDAFRTFVSQRPKPRFIGPMPAGISRNPPPTIMLGLNEARDSYEVVYDPNNLGEIIDPMMLLNFRRRL